MIVPGTFCHLNEENTFLLLKLDNKSFKMLNLNVSD